MEGLIPVGGSQRRAASMRRLFQVSDGGQLQCGSKIFSFCSKLREKQNGRGIPPPNDVKQTGLSLPEQQRRVKLVALESANLPESLHPESADYYNTPTDKTFHIHMDIRGNGLFI